MQISVKNRQIVIGIILLYSFTKHIKRIIVSLLIYHRH